MLPRMIVRTIDEIAGTERDVSGEGWRSRRLIRRDDGVEHSVHYTELQRRLRAAPLVQEPLRDESLHRGRGRGRRTSRPARRSRSVPGTMYVLDQHDRHILRAHTDVTLVCTFWPALTGDEKHDADGSYLPAGGGLGRLAGDQAGEARGDDRAVRLPRVDHLRDLVDDLLDVDAARAQRVAGRSRTSGRRDRRARRGTARPMRSGAKRIACAVPSAAASTVASGGGMAMYSCHDSGRSVSGRPPNSGSSPAWNSTGRKPTRSRPSGPAEPPKACDISCVAEADAERRDLPRDGLAVATRAPRPRKGCATSSSGFMTPPRPIRPSISPTWSGGAGSSNVRQVEISKPASRSGCSQDAEDADGRVLQDEDALGHVTRKRWPATVLFRRCASTSPISRTPRPTGCSPTPSSRGPSRGCRPSTRMAAATWRRSRSSRPSATRLPTVVVSVAPAWRRRPQGLGGERHGRRRAGHQHRRRGPARADERHLRRLSDGCRRVRRRRA